MHKQQQKWYKIRILVEELGNQTESIDTPHEHEFSMNLTPSQAARVFDDTRFHADASYEILKDLVKACKCYPYRAGLIRDGFDEAVSFIDIERARAYALFLSQQMRNQAAAVCSTTDKSFTHIMINGAEFPTNITPSV